MSFCVNIKSQQFKDTASRLGISEGNLELIAHKYGNQKETYGQFPSDNYIISQIAGRPEMNADPSTVEIWHEKYQQAQVFDSKEALEKAMEEARRFFDDSSIGIAALPDGRLQMTVAEPNSTEEPLVSYMANNAEQVIDGKLGVNKEQLISLLGSTMYKANVQSVAVKELLQNAFDAVKIAESQGKTKEKGKIKITLDDTKRTVTVSDNGIGMSPEIVQKAFFTIGGSYKGDNVDNRLKSGGLGLAKMAFLFSSSFAEVSTVKDGVKTYVKTNPEQIQGDNFKITTSKTDEPNGTTVTVGIPEYYMDENGERKDIWFLTRPSFLDEPMIGNVDVEVTEVLSWTTRTKTYDKNQVPEGYTPIGKATSDFGDIEIYVAPQTSNTKYIYGKTLISGLHQFDYMFEANGASKGRFKFIINILPTVGVKSAVYPINNQREGFRATVEPEVSDIAYLMTQINRALERKSVTEAFGSAMSMDVGEVAEVQRESSKENILNETVEEIKRKYAQQQKKILGVPVGKTPDNSISLNDVRVERKKAEDEKKRKSSLDTSGVKFRDSEVSSIDTSKLDVTKPLFHNNTNMVIEEDGQRVLNEIGKLLMELKSLYTQTYKESGILSYNGEPVVDYISKQFWGISFDKGYGGVNVNPSVINMLAINPFYQVREYKGVDTALALTEYLTHLVIHEFNHNYARSEDARFTGRFPATYAEFAGIGKQFNREWKNKLYVLIRDNLETFVKYNKRYEQATNLGESFEGNKVTTGEESTSSRTENDGKDLFWNRSGENVYKDGEGVNEGESVSQSAFTQKQQSQQTIDIWAGKNPVNADLSNMAQRPFRYNGVTYNSVEQAFQSAKLGYAAPITQQYPDVQAALNNPNLSPFDAKAFGRKILGLDQARWDADSPAIMKTLIKESFKQNPQALQRLLATGDAILTHTRERADSRWRTEFPRILMEVRSELRGEQETSLGQQVATQGTTKQYGVVIDSQLKSNYAQWQQQNPNGLVAYRVNYDRYNTPEEATAGRIGNPFSEGQGQENKGADTVQKFFDWLTTDNNFGEAKATEEYRQAIIQKLLNTPVGTPILYYKELGRPSHATVLGYLINHKELIGGQQTVVSQTPAPQQTPAAPKVEETFHKKSTGLVGQINNLLNSGLMATEVREEANKLMDWISDQLTQYLEDPSIVWDKCFASTQDASEREAVIEKISKMSREELLGLIKVEKMLEFYEKEVLERTKENAEYYDNDDSLYDLAETLKPNLKGLIQLGYSRFLEREGFSITLSEGEETTFDVSEVPALSEDVNPDDTNGENNQDYDSEEDGNKQDHWQIETRTRNILADASGAVKQALSNCYVLVDNGKIKEDGTPDYDSKKDKLGRKERISQVNATRSIVRWAQGSLKISDMIDRLSAKEKENPWISQILTRLRDTSGKESDFQSQFFTVFLKHFQPYSVVVRNADGTYHTSQVNAHPALDDAMTAISVQFRLGKLPLFNSEGVDKRNLELLSNENDKLYKLGKLTEENRDTAIGIVGNILEAIGFPQPADAIGRVLNNDVRNGILTAVSNMMVHLRKEIGNKNYDPFKYKDNPNGITGYVKSLLRPFTEALEDVMVSAVFDSGKMYQSYITPSWTTKLFQKMHLDDAHFKEFLLDEFATSEWFIGDANLLADVPAARLARMSEAEKREAKAQYLKDHPEVWRTPWLKEIVSMDEKTRQEAFVHRVQLNFNKSNYMRGMNDLEYVLSVFTEFYADGNKNYRDKKFAYYRLPMLSNKPSNEFIRFTRYSGTTALAEIANEFLNIFNQEISRIQTVMMRNLKEGDEGFIKNFDERGREFQFLDYLNKYLGEEKESVIGKLIADKLAGKTIKESSLTDEILKEIEAHLKTEADALVQQYRENGLFEALKNIENIGESDAAVERAIREFSWNDSLAQANILELLVTDKAYYSGEEDLQKRLAQVHSPGTRGNWDATDYDGNRVSDGKLRVVKIADFKGKDVILNTIANLEEVFDRKIAEADPSLKAQWRAMKESIIDAYKDVNVVDGQAFVSPTAYRKKAIAFGEWSKDAEATYNALRENRYNLPLLKSVFNPRKPFTYGKTNKKVSLNPNLNTPIKTLNYGVQYKDSEYLLIMADAILRGENTSRPNLLGALFDVMEESAAMNPTAGVDFIVFDSGVKSGLSGAISISDLVENPDGREIAFSRIWNSIFEPVGNFSSIREAQQSKTNPYNERYVDILNAEDYSNQQTVPEHFMHGSLQWGSQIRAIMPSDLEVSFMGQPVQYQFYDDAAKKWVALDKKGMREEWDKTTAAMIDESLETVKKELGLDDSSYSQADRNVILSKILQREILHNGRYGVDLLLACSVDENGNFRIPLGDPIQSKRVEQLINSVIKNRVNKQKVEGGTLVEVTNFGTSKRLERRYLDKRDPEGKTLLKSKADYLAEGHSEAEFDQYVKDNQAGIAYDECYAPAWAREVFEKFADANGNIDVEAIEMIDPDFLKMYGYRIPTEEKYSGAPYKIIGFLPKEAGDGFMQPWETTVTDGSDFDVDKKNLMRMAITLKSKIMSKREYAEAEGITDDATLDEKYKAYRKEVSPSAEKILQKIGESGAHTLSSSEEADIKATSDRVRKNRTERAKKTREKKDESALDAYNRKYAERVEPLEKQYEELSNKEDLTAKEERDMLKLDRKIEREIAKLDRELEGAKAKNETAYNEELELIDRRVEEIEKENRTKMLKDKKLSDIKAILEGGIFRNSSTLSPASRKLFLAIKQAYLDMMYESVKPTEGRGYLNNKIFNMQWAIATHASTADKMLNPGNFDPQKRMGYMAAAFRSGKYTWEELQGMTIKELKKLAFTNKNLMDFSVQTQFYKQNNVAGQILGIFAVARSAHAILEGRNYAVNVEDSFTIAGMDFGGLMPIDKMRDKTGVTLIGKTLGSLVGASADAVKDPVLNFMNINKETVNVLNAALRLGMDFDSAALLLSSKAITDILNTYYRNSLFRSMSLGKVVSQRLRKLEGDSRIGKDSALARQELTTEEMIRGIKDVDVMLEYKTLKAFQRLSNIASAINPLTNLSRLNSVKSAVGPTHIDSIMSKRKFNSEMKNLVKIGENGVYENLSMDMVFKDIPSLQSFYEAYNIVFGIEDTEGTGNSVDGLFKQLGITTATQAFENVLEAIPSDMAFTLYNNKKLLSSLGDFFQSYLLVQSGAVDIKQMERYTKNFAKWYTEQGYKSKYPNNPFIQAIQTEVITKKGEQDKYVLKIETTGMEQSEKDALSSGWIQLEKDNPQLSHWLFYYNFWRGGVGFSPKTFMGLVPLQVKENIAGYISTYRNIPSVVGSAVFDQWIRNNWGNDTLVPRVYKMPVRESDGRMIARGNNYYSVAGHPYVKMRMGDGDVLFRRVGNTDSQSEYAEYEQISSLGNNREYFEAYPSSVVPPVQHETALLAEKATVDSDQMASEVDNPNDVVETPEETQRALTEFADQLMGDPNRTAELETAELEDSLSDAIKDLGLSEDNTKFDDMMDEFC